MCSVPPSSSSDVPQGGPHSRSNFNDSLMSAAAGGGGGGVLRGLRSSMGTAASFAAPAPAPAEAPSQSGPAQLVELLFSPDAAATVLDHALTRARLHNMGAAASDDWAVRDEGAALVARGGCGSASLGVAVAALDALELLPVAVAALVGAAVAAKSGWIFVATHTVLLVIGVAVARRIVLLGLLSHGREVSTFSNPRGECMVVMHPDVATLLSEVLGARSARAFVALRALFRFSMAVVAVALVAPALASARGSSEAIDARWLIWGCAGWVVVATGPLFGHALTNGLAFRALAAIAVLIVPCVCGIASATRTRGWAPELRPLADSLAGSGSGSGAAEPVFVAVAECFAFAPLYLSLATSSLARSVAASLIVGAQGPLRAVDVSRKLRVHVSLAIAAAVMLLGGNAALGWWSRALLFAQPPHQWEHALGGAAALVASLLLVPTAIASVFRGAIAMVRGPADPERVAHEHAREALLRRKTKAMQHRAHREGAASAAPSSAAERVRWAMRRYWLANRRNGGCGCCCGPQEPGGIVSSGVRNASFVSIPSAALDGPSSDVAFLTTNTSELCAFGLMDELPRAPASGGYWCVARGVMWRCAVSVVTACVLVLSSAALMAALGASARADDAGEFAWGALKRVGASSTFWQKLPLIALAAAGITGGVTEMCVPAIAALLIARRTPDPSTPTSECLMCSINTRATSSAPGADSWAPLPPPPPPAANTTAGVSAGSPITPGLAESVPLFIHAANFESSIPHNPRERQQQQQHQQHERQQLSNGEYTTTPCSSASFALSGAASVALAVAGAFAVCGGICAIADVVEAV